MATVTSYNLICDADDCDAGPLCNDTVTPYRTAAALRQAAKRQGWVHTPDGHDICPACIHPTETLAKHEGGS